MTALLISFEITLFPEGAKLYQSSVTSDECKIRVEDTTTFKKYICDKYQAIYVIDYILSHNSSTNNTIYYKTLFYKNGVFHAEVVLQPSINNTISDDTIKALIIPLNQNHLTINNTIYSLHVKLCNYQDYNSDELSSLSSSAGNSLEPIIDDCEFYNTDTTFLLDDYDSDDCCDKQCYNAYSLISQLLSYILSYIFTYPNKTVNNKYNKDA